LTRHSVATETAAVSALLGISVVPAQGAEDALATRRLCAADAVVAHGVQATIAVASAAHMPLTALARPARRVQEYLQDPMTHGFMPGFRRTQTCSMRTLEPAGAATILEGSRWGVVQWQDIRFWS
jgi:hypothetical protein